MCLLVLAWKTHPALPMLLAGNRDERHARPTAPADWWPGESWVGGRDLEAGGTWLAADRRGRFAVVTNDPRRAAPAGARSRGMLVPDYLRAGLAPLEFLTALAADADRYAGFSLLVGDRDSVAHFSNTSGSAPLALPPGLYGLGNDGLDVPGPRLVAARERMRTLLDDAAPDRRALFALWSARPSDAADPAPFVAGAVYGTRSTTVLSSDGTRMSIAEQGYRADGTPLEQRSFVWPADP